MKAVIFDFDGTLANSEPAHERAMLVAAADLGLHVSPEQYRAHYVGLDDRDCYSALVARNNAEHLDAMDRFLACKGAEYRRQMLAGDVEAFPGSVALLREAAKQHAVAVCTGALSEEVRPSIEAFGLSNLLGAIVTADEVERSKPDPRSYVLTAARLELDPGDCVAIEDTPAGIASARGAGCVVVGVCHTLPADRLEAAHAVCVSSDELDVERLRELWDAHAGVATSSGE